MDIEITKADLTVDQNLEAAAQLAAVNLLYAQQALGERIVDPTITTKGLLDIAEHSYKVSGMAKKQEAKEDTGKFIFQIIMGDGKDIQIEKEINPLGGADTSESLTAAANNLLENLTFDEAPEFTGGAAAWL